MYVLLNYYSSTTSHHSGQSTPGIQQLQSGVRCLAVPVPWPFPAITGAASIMKIPTTKKDFPSFLKIDMPFLLLILRIGGAGYPLTNLTVLYWKRMKAALVTIKIAPYSFFQGCSGDRLSNDWFILVSRMYHGKPRNP